MNKDFFSLMCSIIQQQIFIYARNNGYIDALKQRERPQYEQRQDKVILQHDNSRQCSATCCTADENLLGNAEIDSSTPLVSID